MNIILTILLALWTVWFVRNTLAYAALWFIKEYRFDRMGIHLSVNGFQRVVFPAFRMPPKSPKGALLTGGTFAGLIACIVLVPGPWLFRFLVAQLIHFPLTAIIVGGLSFPTIAVHRKRIARAKKALDAKENLLAIGVTGSFGKTSVKDYLAAILSETYDTLKTQASKNSPIGIAETVIASLQKQDVFVVEMGAYKKGEIATMAAMVRPQIGIVTAINAQHQDLFGSIENTMQAKYELIAGLSGKNIAILNADDARVRTMGTWAKRDGKTVWWYTRNGSAAPDTGKTFFADAIHEEKGVLSFVVRLGEKHAAVAAPVVGVHQVSNILAAVAAAVAAGMSLAEACRTASAIRPAAGVLQVVKGINGSLFIDDTFNNNPDAAKAALDVLAKQTGKKILVFQPMIELGAFARSSHRDVGRHAALICDRIILTNPSWVEDFAEGVKQEKPALSVEVLPSGDAARELRRIVRKGDTVLFKGKEAGLVLKKL